MSGHEVCDLSDDEGWKLSPSDDEGLTRTMWLAETHEHVCMSGISAEQSRPVGFRIALGGSWIVSFALGCLLASKFAVWPEPPSTNLETESLLHEVSQTWQQQVQPWAYVMVADDPAEQTSRPSLWAAMALARSIQQFTAHRMVLLTNYDTFPDGTDVKNSFSKLGVEIRPFVHVDIPEHQTKPYAFRSGFEKFQVWNLVDLERVVWLDNEALAYRSLDWLFLRDGMWGGRHDWACKLNQPYLNSGILSLTPSQQDYDGMVSLSRKNPHLSVHQVIVQYFRDQRRPVSLLTDLEAAYGRCMNSGVPSPYISKEGKKVNGLWSTADFVHKSGGYGQDMEGPHNNICFSHDVTPQKYYMGNTVLNICQFHPLGAHWRMLFCDAATTLGIRDVSAQAFCNDHCYYWGADDDGNGVPCSSGRIDETPDYEEYYNRVTGVPGPEMEGSSQQIA